MPAGLILCSPEKKWLAGRASQWLARGQAEEGDNYNPSEYNNTLIFMDVN
jgi:hypothetical protein